MNIRDKKVQHIIFSAIAGCGLLFVVLQFLILPAISSWKENSAKAMETQKEVNEMRQVIQLRPAVNGQIETARAAIKTFAANIPLPVLGNYLLGMEGHLRGCVSNIGVTVVTIADNDVLEITPGNSKFKIYRVRVQARASFHDYVQLVKNIHSSNPLCTISGINIVARDGSPLAHEMNFIVSWLVWSDPAKRPAFLMEDKK